MKQLPGFVKVYAMNESPDNDETLDAFALSADSLDVGLAAAFARATPISSFGFKPTVMLKEANGESSLVVKPASDAMPTKEETGDRYRLDGEIARGGMGAVLRGRDVDLGRDLAVKVLLEKYANRPDVARRFIEEAQIGGQLQHPGVVPIYDIGRFGDRPFFTMKLVKGQTLAAILRERADASADRPRLLNIALQVAQAMAYAHAKGVIHRDLKPANIMVGAFGEVQVMDWGLAKVLAEGGIADEEKASRAHNEHDAASLIRTARSTGSAGSFGTDTEAGSLLGTPAYMPPEQANGDIARLDRRADVFGLGAILCEILTGKPPYLGRSSEEVRRKAANGDLADATARLDACGADAELIHLTKLCLAPELIDRPKDAQAVSDGISTYMNGVQERLQAAERERAVAEAREIEERKRRRVQLALAAAVVALMLGGGAFAWWRNEQVQVVRQRDARNAEAVAALLIQCEEALRANDAAKAAVALDAAKKRSAEGGAEKEASRLKRLDADLALLVDLDSVDQFRWTIVADFIPSPAVVVRRTREAIRRFGADPEAVSLEEASARISASIVRERIVSALDRVMLPIRLEDWDRLTVEQPGIYTPQARTDIAALLPKTAGVRALLKRVDADPYRDAVRDAVVAEDRAKFVELAGQKAALEQPSGFVAVLGENQAIAEERRRQLLMSAVSRRPKDLSLLFTLALSYPDAQESAVDEQLRWYQAAVAAAPANAVALQSLGQTLDFKGQPDEAIAYCKKAVEIDPESAAAHNSLGSALRRKGRLDEAIACLKKAIQLDPKFAASYVNLADALKAKGRVDDAIASLAKAIELEPKLASAHNNLAIALHDKGRFDEAIACWEKAIELDPKFAGSYVNLGNALMEKGQFDAAITLHKKAIDLDPKYAQAYYSMGNALSRKGQLDDAIAWFKKAIETNPKFTPTYLNLGNVLQETGQFDEAITYYQKNIELDPKHALAHHNLGNVLSSKGQLDEAIARYKRAVDLDPKFAVGHNSLGIAHSRKGHVDEAIACFNKAVELDLRFAAAYVNLGNELRGKGQLDEAIACFKKALDIKPKDAKAHRDLGIALSVKGQWDEAIACWRKSVELDPKNAHTHNNIGIALAQKGRFEQAIACFKKALELDPNHASARAGLGVALLRARKLDEAVESLEKAVELEPNNAANYNNLGGALLEKDQLDKAAACFRKAIEIHPKDPVAYANLGVALARRGELDEAAACFKSSIDLDPKNAKIHNDLGRAFADRGQWEAALVCYKKAIELEPNFALAHWNSSLALTSLGRFAESLEAMSAATSSASTSLAEAAPRPNGFASSKRKPRWRPSFQPFSRAHSNPAITRSAWIWLVCASSRSSTTWRRDCTPQHSATIRNWPTT